MLMAFQPAYLSYDWLRIRSLSPKHEKLKGVHLKRERALPVSTNSTKIEKELLSNRAYAGKNPQGRRFLLTRDIQKWIFDT